MDPFKDAFKGTLVLIRFLHYVPNPWASKSQNPEAASGLVWHGVSVPQGAQDLPREQKKALKIQEYSLNHNMKPYII